MAKIFISYSHKDEEYLNRLKSHFSTMRRTGQIEIWYDREIYAGDEFDSEISRNLENADIILLLASANFLDSDYCYTKELTIALERHSKGDVEVIPVILTDCDWKSSPFGRLQATPKDGKPISNFERPDKGYLQVVEDIKKVLGRTVSIRSDVPFGVKPPDNAEFRAVHLQSQEYPKAPAASDLRIARELTDRDRDEKCGEGIRYLFKFFENSLEQLSDRYTEIETVFRKRRQDGFECTIYLNGQQACHCGIWGHKDRFGPIEIRYSVEGISEGSYNERITIGTDCYRIGYKPIMSESLFTINEMAEHLWGLLTEPLSWS